MTKESYNFDEHPPQQTGGPLGFLFKPLAELGFNTPDTPLDDPEFLKSGNSTSEISQTDQVGGAILSMGLLISLTGFVVNSARNVPITEQPGSLIAINLATIALTIVMLTRKMGKQNIPDQAPTPQGFKPTGFE